MRILSWLLPFVICFHPHLLSAQWGSLDTSFNSTDHGYSHGDGALGLNDYIAASHVQADNKILIVGSFNNYNAYGRSGLIRLLADGTPDITFNNNAPGVLGSASCLAQQSDGKVIIGGSIISYNWVSQNFITRVKTDGRLDSSFTPGSGTDSWVNSIAIQPDNKIIIAGNFNYYNGVPRAKLARLNSDGTLDNSFQIGSGFNGQLYSVMLQPDGKILAAGSFSDFNGNARNCIVRLLSNGSIDSSFVSTGYSSSTIFYTAYLQGNGQIVVAGNFSSYNSTTIQDVARINSDGSLDVNFSPGTGTNGIIYSVVVQPDGKPVLAGNFISFNNTICKHIIRLNVDGSIDNSFSVPNGADKQIQGITLMPSGDILAGGSFQRIGTKPYYKFCKLHSDGSVDTSFNRGQGANNAVRKTMVMPDGRMMVVGNFNGYNGWHGRGVTRILSNGNVDTSLHTGYGVQGYYNYVTLNTAELQPDGKVILAGGNFSYFDSNAVYNLVRILPSGAIDNSFNTLNGVNDKISCSALASNGNLILGGLFTMFNTSNRNKIVRLLPNGTLDNTFNPGSGADAEVTAVAVQSDNKIYLSGYFTNFNGQSRNRMLRLLNSGSIDNTFNIGTGLNSFANKIIVQPDGAILIGGAFTQYNGVSVNRIARILPNGTLDNSFQSGSGFDYTVTDILLLPSGKLVVSGNFTSYNGITCKGLVRLNADGSIDAGFNAGQGTDGITNISKQQDGKLIISGGFTSYDGIGRNRVARIESCLITNQLMQTACDSFVWNGTTYTNSGSYAQHFITAQGCDSTIWLNLTVLHSSDTTLTITACDSLSLNSQTYTQSGNYTQHLSNASGCDSSIYINLTIHTSSNSMNTYIACDTYTWNNVTYTSSGIYAQTLQNAMGCDSLAILQLTINHASFDTLQAQSCGSITINGQTYTSSGTYNQLLVNSNGCDSLLTLDVTILSPLASISVNGAILSSIGSSGSYQWVTCPDYTPISGATAASYTATNNGDYALIVSQSTCSDTSICITINSLGLNENQESAFSLYPNPSSGWLFIQGEHVEFNHIKVFNVTGVVVFEGNNEGAYDLGGLADGAYLVRLEKGDKVWNHRFLKYSK